LIRKLWWLARVSETPAAATPCRGATGALPHLSLRNIWYECHREGNRHTPCGSVRLRRLAREVCEKCWLGVSLVIFPFTASPLFAFQANAQTQFHLEGFSVAVDVVVTDRNGRILKDLSHSNFRLIEDGVVHEVDSVQFIERLRGEIAEKGSEDFPRQDGFVNQLQADSSVTRLSSTVQTGCVVFLIDLSTMDLSGRRLLEGALVQFFEEVFETGGCGAIFTLDPGFGVRQEFTSEKKLLVDAASNLVSSRLAIAQMDVSMLSQLTYGNQFLRGAEAESSEYQTRRLLDSVELAEGGGSSRGAEAFTWRIIQSYLTMRSFMERRHSSELLRAVKAIAAGLSEVEGRKTLILVSEGFVVRSENERELAETVQTANRANLAVYGIDPHGLVPYGVSSSYAPRGQLSGVSAASGARRYDAIGGESLFDRARTAGTDVKDSSLRYLSSETGGFTIRNSNDLSRGLRRVYAESEGYYLLSYRPKRQIYDGEFRKIEVKVDFKGAIAHHRSGYLAMPPGLETLSPDQFLLLQSAGERAIDLSLPARFSASVFPSASLEQRILIIFELETDGLHFVVGSFAEGKSVHSAKLLLVLSIFNEATNRAETAFALPLQLHLTEDDRRELSQLTFFEELSSFPGRRRVIALVYDEHSEKAAYFETKIDIPRIQGQSLASQIVLGKGVRPASERDALLTVDGATLLPIVSHVFHPDDRLIFLLEVCPGSASKVHISFTLTGGPLDGSVPVADHVVPANRNGPQSCVAVSRFIELAELPPGKYRLTARIDEDAGLNHQFRKAEFQVKDPLE
jgi:VWFA-related protein